MAARSGTMCMATTLPSMNCSAMPPTWPAKKRRYFYPPAPGQPRWPAQPLPARRRVYRRPGRITICTKPAARRSSAVFSRSRSTPRRMVRYRWIKWRRKSNPTISILPHPPAEPENTHNGKVLPRDYLQEAGRLPASAIWRCTSTARASLTPWWPTAASYAISPNTATPSPSACQRGLALR